MAEQETTGVLEGTGEIEQLPPVSSRSLVASLSYHHDHLRYWYQ